MTKYKFDFRATAFSKTLVSFFNFTLLIAYIKIWQPTKPKDGSEGSWIPWNKDLWKDWKGYLAVTLPIAFSFYLEGLMFETSTIIANYFPLVNKEYMYLDVHVAIGNTSTFFFYIGVGFNVATSVLIGINMGAGKINKVKNLIYASFLCIVILTVIEESFLYKFDDEWASLFACWKYLKERTERTYLFEVLWVYRVSLLIDNIQSMF